MMTDKDIYDCFEAWNIGPGEKIFDKNNGYFLCDPVEVIDYFLNNYKSFDDSKSSCLSCLVSDAFLVDSETQKLRKDKIDELVDIFIKEDRFIKYSPKSKDWNTSAYLIWDDLAKIFINYGKSEEDTLNIFVNRFFYRIISKIGFSDLKDWHAYRYRKCDKYFYESLINNQLVFSALSTLNDPFETRYYDYFLKHGSKEEIYTAKALLKFTKLASFVKADNHCVSIVGRKINKNFSYDSRLDLMWAHYADSHKGVCVKYYFKNDVRTYFLEKELALIASDIKYCNVSDLNSSFEDWFNPMHNNVEIDASSFFCKNEIWKYEKEVRLLYYNPEKKESHVSVPLKENCIEAIYFGCKCPENDIQAICNVMTGKTCDNKSVEYKLITLEDFMLKENEIGDSQTNIDEILKTVRELRAKE